MGTILNATNTATGGDFFHLGVNGGKLHFEARIASTIELYGISTGNVDDDSWHHVTLTMDADGNHLYLDGQELTTGDGRVNYSSGGETTQRFFADIPSADSLRVGAIEFAPDTYFSEFNGMVDDLRVYDRALSSADVVEVMNYSPPSDLSSGIELNSDGGNDAYLVTTNGGAILGV